MTGGQQCVIIVPRSAPELYARLREHFADDTRIFVRMDSRTGERASRTVEVFAVGGGARLSPELAAHVSEQLRRLGSPLGS